MRKTTYRAVVCLLFCMPLVYLNAQLATWPLDSDSLATGISSNPVTHTVGDFTRGNGISALNFEATGVNAKKWPTANRRGQVDYYEVCVTPKAGITLNVTGLQYSESRTGDGVSAYELFWSTNGFETSHRIDSVGIPDNINFRHITISGLDIYSCDSKPICFRWYGFGAESDSGEWKFKNDSLRINGTVLSPCMAPSTSPSAVYFTNTSNNSTQVNFTAGDGDGRLVVMRLDEPVSAEPCNYVNYAASQTFANGADIGNGEYVVYNGNGTSVTVNGLEEGGVYYVAVFEYDAANPCFKKTDPATSVEKMRCLSPMDVENLLESSGDTKVTLAWDDANCYDEVLVVAGTASIMGTPAGDGMAYTPDPVFGNGTGFGPNEYPVFQGNLAKAEITGLTNGTTYYFKVFARLGTDWSSGVEISSKPTAGCVGLGGESVFINEVHYRNAGPDIDEGVEIAGPADKDLSSYVLFPYGFSYSPELNMSGGIIYDTLELTGRIDDEGNQFGSVWVPVPGMWDARAGIVLYNKTTETVVQFLSYRGGFEAIEGVALGMTSDNVIPTQSINNPDSMSVQLAGTGECPSDLYWVGLVLSSRGAINANQNLLPIELLYFTATPKEEDVLIEWETVVEVNNDYMAVEHSIDGRNFTEIGKVAGAGSTLEPQYYNFLHTNPVPGINYYRLRQVDFDGKETYHKIVAVQFKTEEQVVLLYPTASREQVNLQVSAPIETVQEIRVMDVTGRVIFAKELEIGQSHWELPIGNFHPGHYFLQMELNGELVVKRFVKM